MKISKNKLKNIIIESIREVFYGNSRFVKLYSGTDSDWFDLTSNGIWLTPDIKEARNYGETIFEVTIDNTLVNIIDEDIVLKYIDKYSDKTLDIIDYLIAPWEEQWYKNLRHDYPECDGYQFKYENGVLYIYLFDAYCKAIVNIEDINLKRK